MDSCENARDEHHIYSRGWGKKMSYCIAFSVEGGAEDVSQAYILPEKWEEARRMRAEAGSEEDAERVSMPISMDLQRPSRRPNLRLLLSQILKAIRDRRRFGLSEADLTRLASEDEVDRNWWKPTAEVSVEGLTLSPPSDEGLEGRKSGTEEWKASRGESGQ